jgi:hypothetical protein
LRYPDQRHVFEAVHHWLRETGSFKPRTHVGHGRCNVQDDEVVLDAVHDNPSSSTHRIASQTGLSQSALWRVTWKWFASFSSTTCARATTRGQRAPSWVLSMVSTQNYGWTRLFELCALGQWGKIHKRWSNKSPQFACMGRGESSSNTILFISEQI